MSLPCRFYLVLECRNIALELCDESMGRFKLIRKLSIGGGQCCYRATI
jgi:hypothetical protein